MKRLLETSFLWILLICEILFYFTDILDMTWKFITLTSCFNTEHVDQEMRPALLRMNMTVIIFKSK